ncbi:SH3 domain-containing protein [Methylobacterium sp. E-041]|uniref:SH3 domain-containing protein n=1 Tax=Methylobacterium sp. E-041 TaxID=2836573 RepID=UPI001FBBCE80|nr:SH3 domain-containing protein [Methylobacterium sp. E-041]MCJ2108637.1 SH3 domain-containing protein [Methylobacterium sp. E-041]
MAVVQPVNLPPSPPASVTAPAPAAPETLYVIGKRVPLRDDGRAGSPILDRLASEQAVMVIERREEWVRVRHSLTQREGWIQAKRLTATAPPAVDENPKSKPPSVGPVLSTAAIAKALIAASLASYPSSCACPYQTDRGGRSCGRRSAYSRPSGYSPLCYTTDITHEMVAEYRASH